MRVLMWYEYMEKIYGELFNIDEQLIFINNELKAIKYLFVFFIVVYTIKFLCNWYKKNEN